MSGYIGSKSRVALTDSYAKKQADANFAPITRSRKNLLINGGFDIWQREGPFTGGFFADRWFVAPSGGTVSVTKETFLNGQADVPGNPSYFAKIDVTTGNDYCSFRQRVENVRSLSGKSVTLSFWAKGSNPAGGDFDVRFIQNFGSGGTASSSVVTNGNFISLGSEWAKYTVSVEIPSISGKTIDGEDHYLEIDIGQASDVSTDPWTFNIAQDQLEIGDTATDFEYRPIGEELALCRRYFQTFNSIEGFPYGSDPTTARRTPYYFTSMRSTPSVTITSYAGGDEPTLRSVDTAYLVLNAVAAGTSAGANASGTLDAEL